METLYTKQQMIALFVAWGEHNAKLPMFSEEITINLPDGTFKTATIKRAARIGKKSLWSVTFNR